jgi:Subtilase family/FG-GAP-like repeat
MPRFAVCVLFSLFVLLAVPQISPAMQLAEQWPTLATWEHRTAWPVTLTFEASLDPATVDQTSFWVAPKNAPGQPVAGVIEVVGVALANDTIQFTPDERWELGRRYVFHAMTAITSSGGDPFDGVFLGDGEFVANVPMDLDRPDYDPSDPFAVFVNANVLPAFDVIDPESTDPSQPWTIPGMGATEAWKVTTGRPDVVVAIIDNGLSDYHEPELADRLFLNQGELQQPRDGADLCPGWDCNGDGRVSASDYAADPRVGAPPAGLPLSPAELLDAFADGFDDDGNGLVDDISGWDFMRQRPEPIGISEWPEGDHGGARARDVAAIADNDNDDKPGFCPNCTILAIRVSDAILASHNQIGQGVDYAAAMGAQVAVAASGTPDYSWENEQSVLDAYDAGMLLIAAAGDELGFHHSYPAAGEAVFSVKSVFPIPNVDLFGIFPMSSIGFAETYCTNYNEHVHSAGASGACSSEATGNVGGVAGLLHSRALDLGIPLEPDEIKQLLTMTSDDIQSHCITLTGGGCQPGFDRHFGYGRPNLLTAMEALGDGADHQIPPTVEIRGPRWWTMFDPNDSPLVDIEARLFARGEPFDYVVQAARGPEPLDAEFVVIASGSGVDTIDGVVAVLDLYDLFTDAEMRAPFDDPDQYTFTVRVRALRQTSKGLALGEDRRAFAAYTDDDPNTGYLPGLPFDLLASGESSPILYDLDGRDGGKLELIFGTTAGNVEVFGIDADSGEWARRPGFPVSLRDDGYAKRDSAVAPPAVGDLFGDGTPYIVVVTGSGRIFVVHPSGNLHTAGGEAAPFLDGFPYQAPYPSRETPRSFGHGNTFAGAPVLADLDEDGILEIIAPNFQADVYAVKPVDADNDGMADDLAGFPVQALSLSGAVPRDLVCKNDDGQIPDGIQILGTPAVGILDPASADPARSQRLSIVVPTTEVCVDGGRKTGRLYAIRYDGNNGPDGPFHEGWPQALPAPLSDALPIPPLTTGITAAPAMAYVGDTTLIGTGAFAYLPIILTVHDGEVTRTPLPSNLSLNISGHGAFGRMRAGGPLHYALPTLSAIKIVDGWISMLRPLVMAWDMSDTAAGPVIQQSLEDIHFYGSPAMADLNGDGETETIIGSSGFVLHAVSPDGTQPAGWPKFTFNWIISSVTVGDADRDGSLDLFVPTHEGKLFGWRTEGPACAGQGLNGEWRRFHHDERNTGVLGNDTTPPSVILGLVKEAVAGGVRLTWQAPGGDWDCGRAAAYEIRMGNDADALLTPAGFAAATIAHFPLAPRGVGGEETWRVDDADVTMNFAIRAIDAQGNIGHIALAGLAEDADDDDTPSPSDDDDATPGDDDAADEDDDEHSVGGCGGC